MTGFIFHPSERQDSSKETRRSDDDFHNLIRADLFCIFPNIKRMEICCNVTLEESYSFSLVGFLNVLSETSKSKWSEIVIKTVNYAKYNWIYKEWNSHSKLQN